MDELEAIRQRRLAELQQRQFQQQMQQQNRLQAQINALEELARRVLTKEALARYGNIKSAHPELAVRILAVLAQAVQQTDVAQITDEQFREMLQHILPQKRETKITFK